uniref:Uncharacterized protein n=1 Tax=Romanomermis culicivorax TaxID=13658 RepID=A0A915KI49_ROMCU
MVRYVLENHVPPEYHFSDENPAATTTTPDAAIAVDTKSAAILDIQNLKASLENLENTLNELKRQVERDESSLAHWENVVENPPALVSPSSSSSDWTKSGPARPIGSFQTLLNALLLDEKMWIENMVQLMEVDSTFYPGPIESRRAIFNKLSVLINRYDDLKRERDDLGSRFEKSSRLFDSIHQLLPSRLESRDRLLRSSRRFYDELARENQSRQRFYGQYPTLLNLKYDLPPITPAFSASLTDLYNWAKNEIERSDHLKAALVLKPSSGKNPNSSLAEVDSNFHQKATKMRFECETIERDLEKAKLLNARLKAEFEKALSKPPKKKAKLDSSITSASQIPDQSCLQNEIGLEKELMNKTLLSVQKLRLIVDKQHEENDQINQLLAEHYDKIESMNKNFALEILAKANELGDYEEKCEKMKKLKREIMMENFDFQAIKENVKRLKQEVAVGEAKLLELQNFLSQSNRCLNDLKLYTKQIGEQKSALEQYLVNGDKYNEKLDQDLKEACSMLDKVQDKFRSLKKRLSGDERKLAPKASWRDMGTSRGERTNPLRDRLEDEPHEA